VVPGLIDLDDGQIDGFSVGPTTLLGCRVGRDLFAYLDRCAGCAESLTGGSLARRLGGSAGDAALRCPSCGRHFSVRRAGVCFEQSELHLDPLPLLVDRGVVSVAVPTPVPA